MRTCTKCGLPNVDTNAGPATCRGCQRRHNPKTAIRRRPHRRTVTPRGEQHGRALLTADQAADVRRRSLAGESSSALAAEFGVTPSTVTHIKKGRTWRDLGVAQLV